MTAFVAEAAGPELGRIPEREWTPEHRDSILTSVHNVSQSMKDCKASVQSSHDRLAVILQELKDMKAKNTTPPSGVVEKVHRALAMLWGDIAPYEDISLVARMLRHSRLHETIKKVNEEIDGLFQMLAITPTNEIMEWKNKWELDAKTYDGELKKLTENNYTLMEHLRSPKAQMDAIMLLKYEVDKIDKNESMQSQDVQRFVTQSIRTVARLSNGVGIPVRPDWFIPESSVTFTPEYFARGSFGTVHHGKYLGSEVVVKLLLPGQNGIELPDKDGFLNESNLWHKFDFPHVVKMLGACHISNRPFIVSNFAENGNVADWLARPASGFQMWKCMYEAALGLNYLHSKQVIHGDLKLNNLLVGADKKVLVADFGLSRIKTSSKSRSSKLKSGTQVDGGLHWLAPERFTDKPSYYSDVYALGMCIIEAASGDAPYGHMDDFSVRENIKNGVLPPKPESLSDDGWALVQKMTMKKSSDRIKLEDAIEELKHLADGEGKQQQDTGLYCKKCNIYQRAGAEWCDRCGLYLSGEHSRSVAYLLLDLDASSQQAKDRAPRLLYQAIAADANVRRAAEPSRSVLLSIAQETDRLTQAIYAVGCLEAIGTVSTAEMAPMREKLRVVVSENVSSLLALLNAQDPNQRDERQAAELVLLALDLLSVKPGALYSLVGPLAMALTQEKIEVRGAVVLALWELTKNHEDNLRELVEVCVTAPLFDVVASRSPQLQQPALRLLLQVVSNSPSAARECGTRQRIRQLVDLLEGEEKETAVALVKELAEVGHEMRVQLGRGELVHDLVDLLMKQDTTLVLKSEVFMALAALVQVPLNASKFVDAGGITSLKALPVSEMSEEMLLALSRFVENDTIRAAVIADKVMLKACLDAFAAKDMAVETYATRLLGELVKGYPSVVAEMRRVTGLMTKLAKRSDDDSVTAILNVIDALAGPLPADAVDTRMASGA